MQTTVLPTEDQVALVAAKWIATEARQAIAERGQFLLAVSGGKTPWVMLGHLAQESLPWSQMHFFQVDERVAPEGDEDRNLTHLRQCLLPQTSFPQDNIHPMPVNAPDLAAAADSYAATLAEFAGQPAVLDVIHLGLGADGHTASLVPGDAALTVLDRDVAVTGLYQNRLRMTMTYPLLNRARSILWLATGPSKREMLRRLLAGDAGIPAGSVSQRQALLMTDQSLTL